MMMHLPYAMGNGNGRKFQLSAQDRRVQNSYIAPTRLHADKAILLLRCYQSNDTIVYVCCGKLEKIGTCWLCRFHSLWNVAFCCGLSVSLTR